MRDWSEFDLIEAARTFAAALILFSLAAGIGVGIAEIIWRIA